MHKRCWLESYQWGDLAGNLHGHYRSVYQNSTTLVSPLIMCRICLVAYLSYATETWFMSFSSLLIQPRDTPALLHSPIARHLSPLPDHSSPRSVPVASAVLFVLTRSTSRISTHTPTISCPRTCCHHYRWFTDRNFSGHKI